MTKPRMVLIRLLLDRLDLLVVQLALKLLKRVRIITDQANAVIMEVGVEGEVVEIEAEEIGEEGEEEAVDITIETLTLVIIHRNQAMYYPLPLRALEHSTLNQLHYPQSLTFHPRHLRIFTAIQISHSNINLNHHHNTHPNNLQYGQCTRKVISNHISNHINSLNNLSNLLLKHRILGQVCLLLLPCQQVRS